jgi:hypothetical protein
MARQARLPVLVVVLVGVLALSSNSTSTEYFSQPRSPLLVFKLVYYNYEKWFQKIIAPSEVCANSRYMCHRLN